MEILPIDYRTCPEKKTFPFTLSCLTLRIPSTERNGPSYPVRMISPTLNKLMIPGNIHCVSSALLQAVFH
jgi:hypothetical protein